MEKGKENATWCLKVSENSAAPLKDHTHTYPRLQLTYFWRAIEILNFLIFLLSVAFFELRPLNERTLAFFTADAIFLSSYTYAFWCFMFEQFKWESHDNTSQRQPQI